MFPTQMRQNDTLSFTTTLDSKYDDFTLTYYLNNEYSTVATFADGVFVVEEHDTDWEPGQYQVVGVVTDGVSRFTVESCFTEVLPDISQIADSSSHIKKILNAVEATILGSASKEQESYKVSGRELKYKSIEELLKLKDVYMREYALERKACDAAQGIFHGNIKVRFS